MPGGSSLLYWSRYSSIIEMSKWEGGGEAGRKRRLRMGGEDEGRKGRSEEGRSRQGVAFLFLIAGFKITAGMQFIIISALLKLPIRLH